MKRFTPAFVIWLAFQFFSVGFVRQGALNHVRLNAYNCGEPETAFVAGLWSVLVPVSLIVPEPPEVVTYCATQRAERALKIPAPLAESK